MNNTEALKILRKHLDDYRQRQYSVLVTLIDQPQTKELNGTDGTTYQVEIEVFWDAEPGGAIRVLGSIDDKGARALAPLNEDFILAPDGHFVGE